MTNNREWMKTRHLAVITIMILSTLTSMTFHPAQGISGSAFFMKSNSTAKLYADFTIPVLNNQNWDLKPEIFTSTDDSITNPSDLTIDANPSSFTGNSHHVYVTYTLTSKGNTKGVYSLFLFFCGSSPLVVGLNESEVNPAIYNKFFTAVYLCPAMSAGTPDLNIIGYSGIISKTLSISSNGTITVTSVSKLGEPLQSPLKQFKSGIKAEDVKCNPDFILAIKLDYSPACITESSATKLFLRGWALGFANYQPVYFMNSSSTAQIIVKYFPNKYQGAAPPDFSIPLHSWIYDTKSNYPLALIAINATSKPNYVHTNSVTTVNYTITAGNTKGVYWLSLLDPCVLIPIAVNLDESELMTSTLQNPGDTRSCPPPDVQFHVVGVSNATLRLIDDIR